MISALKRIGARHVGSRSSSAGKCRGFRGGAVALEAALVLPILLILTFGLIEFGLFFYVQHNLKGAAQAGARAGIPFGANNAAVTTAVTKMMTAAGYSSSQYTVTVSPADVSAAAAGSDVSVTVQCVWSDVGAVRPLGDLSFISGSKVLRGTSVMRKE